MRWGRAVTDRRAARVTVLVAALYVAVVVVGLIGMYGGK